MTRVPLAARAAAGMWAAGATIGLLGIGAGVGLGTSAGCSDPCCTTDSFPINLVPASSFESGGLVAQAQYPNGDVSGQTTQKFLMSIDTGSSLTFFRRNQDEKNQMVLRDFDLLDAAPPPDPAGTPVVVRGLFRGIEVLPVNLDPTGPEAVLGGAFLRNFSVHFDFSKPALTFWWRQGATDAFLAGAGFVVLHFNLLGGAELTALSRPDFLGLTGPVEAPPTRVVFRACGAPAPFDPNAPEAERCCKGEEVTPRLKTGADLALMVATGVGPLVLSQSAWDRVKASNDAAALPQALPNPVAGAPLTIPTLSAPITDVTWSWLPRLALVDQEADDTSNPGACVELGRSRRLEWVERHLDLQACAQPCDTDPRDGDKAQNAAAYVEVGEPIPVAIVPDGTPLLQGLRAEIRPEGPEIDGLIGSAVLAHMTMELDYKGQPTRALLTCAPLSSCNPAADRNVCWASPRCQRLANATETRSCFCQPRRSLPASCRPSECQ